ncbi:MAG: SRPBCC domain-containing protein [Rhizobiales bacterium]|nr:SRPBCC domain-containing protein [Hyphomicrobiales bacterium]MBO6699896.1 SRPBCC domain-containing protein [Hyphomicrobiales bacterium]MBO6737434.1 SRPBCC domain-containing protein [Hyphomicrobiales bacterium]MBO6911492.1 SRPBCC domain-containing protein [Hyphomicrobiales bacterium]MBO6955208.1 SRPBCC domain-containing protein [Hyphomicrobiales bacterium]
MGFSYTAQCSIAAPPSTVWQVLTDRQALIDGDFGITQLDGNLAPGGKLVLRAAIAPKQAFKLKVTAFDVDRRMVWTGGMPFGLFSGTRTFTLAPAGEGTQFTVEEVFSGPLAGLIGRSMPDLQPSFEQFADALKQTAEERAKGDAA